MQLSMNNFRLLEVKLGEKFNIIIIIIIIIITLSFWVSRGDNEEAQKKVTFIYSRGHGLDSLTKRPEVSENRTLPYTSQLNKSPNP